MKCSNCGEELPKGTLICPRCGTRQTANANSGGNGGNNGGGNNRKNNSGGNGNKKIIGLVAAVVLIVVGIVFGIKSLNRNNNDAFTHDIQFDKQNLSVTDNKELRLREISSNQKFNVGIDNGYVDISIVDENDKIVDYKIQQVADFGRYEISPNSLWDTAHTYYMSLGDGTYFTDEDMYQFKKLIFTVKKENVATYTLNKNIIELSEHKDYKVKAGDVVGYEDVDGNKKYGKAVLNNNGNIVYEDASLVDLFEELELVGDYSPDYSQIVWDNDGKKEFIYDIKHSDFFLNMVQTVYAGNVKYTTIDNVENLTFGVVGALGFNSKNIAIDDICTIDLDLKVKTQKEDCFGDIDNSIGDNTVLVLEIEFEFNPVNGKLFGSSVSDDTTMVVSLTKKMGSVVKANVDIQLYSPTTFDIQFLDYSEDAYTIDMKWESKYKSLDETKALIDFQFGDNIDKDIKITDDLDNNLLDLKNNLISLGENKLETQKIYRLFNVPIQTPIPVLNVDISVFLNGNFKAEVKAGHTYSCISKTRSGIELNKQGELTFTKLLQKTGEVEAYYDGELNGRIGVSPQVHLAIGVFGYNPVSIGVGFETGCYGKVSGKIKYTQSLTLSTDFQKKYSANIRNRKYKFISELDLSAGAEGSIEMGLYASIFVDGEINIIKPILRAKYYFLNEEYPFAKQKGNIKIDKTGIKATSSTVRIGDIGTEVGFGPYRFKVIDKDASKGIALIVTTEGIESRPYYVGSEGINTATVTWANSSLRKYLNGDFLKKFDPKDVSAIYESIIKAEDNPQGVKGGEDTTDKVFILSKSELEKYFKKKEDRQLKASADAIKQGAYECTEEDIEKGRIKGNTVYWVRNPGTLLSAMNVNSDGSINEIGPDVGRKDICVRPAMWVRDEEHYARTVREGLANAIDGVVDLANDLEKIIF